MYSRILNFDELLKRKSFFLLGPRQTGKSTFLKQRFPRAKVFDLLEADTFRELATRPESIRKQLTPQDELIIIDEIQKLPALLDEVQALIDRNKALRFILTGSSARKLRRRGVNLLGGRALTARLHPLVSPEIGFERLIDRLNVGGLPAVLDSPIPHEELGAYVGDYLKEEVLAEGAARSIEGFSRFLEVAGSCNGQQVNFTEIGNDAQVKPRTVREYFQVLDDTLLAYQLHPFQHTSKRKPVATAKLYFFDIGIANTLMRRGEVVAGSPNFGDALEHLIFLELRAFLDYNRKDLPLTFWRTLSQVEVDFVIDDTIAIEVKARASVTERDSKHLRAFEDEKALKHKIIVCTATTPSVLDDGTLVLSVDQFLRDLWSGRFC